MRFVMNTAKVYSYFISDTPKFWVVYQLGKAVTKCTDIGDGLIQSELVVCVIKYIADILIRFGREFIGLDLMRHY